jgi:hypothetical protein
VDLASCPSPPRLFAGLARGLITRVVLPAHLSATTATVIAWDVGVLVYLVLAAMLFTSERVERMAQDAERQQAPVSKERHTALVAATLLLSWLMTLGVMARIDSVTQAQSRTEVPIAAAPHQARDERRPLSRSQRRVGASQDKPSPTMTEMPTPLPAPPPEPRTLA